MTLLNGVTFNVDMMAEFDVLLMQLFHLLHDYIFNPIISEFKQVAKGLICAIYPDSCSIPTEHASTMRHLQDNIHIQSERELL